MSVLQAELIDAGVSTGLLDAETVTRLRVEARRRQEDILDTVTRHGRFPRAALYRALAEVRQMPFIDLGTVALPEELIRQVREPILRKAQCLPVSQDARGIVLAAANPDDRQALGAIQRFLRQPVRVGLADPESVDSALDRIFSADAESGPALDPVALLDRILKESYLRRASDVHLEPEANGLRVRLRIDGRLHTYMGGLDHETGVQLLSRVKVLADLNIAEQRAPQDGRLSHSPLGPESKPVDIRVATMPTRWGERATLRLLGTETGQLSLEALGMLPEDLKQFEQVIRRPHGIILLTGPTGSGKSTTLYAAMRAINQPHLNILTVEDPVECLVPGISQVHVNWTDKVTFASALRSLLRHDPDVLMVGEIRDRETADMALKAALTGHLLFSTLHTNTACGAVTRLVDIGCEPFLLGATLSAVIAQRLVRRLCQRCKRPRRATPEECSVLGHEGHEVTICDPRGCAHCLGTGFRGRIGLFECLWIDKQVSRMISQGAGESDLQRHCAPNLTTLRMDGCAKVLAGVTSLDEVLTATVLD